MRDYAPVTTDERDDVASSDLGRAEPFMETHDFERIAQGDALGKYNLLLGVSAAQTVTVQFRVLPNLRNCSTS